MAQQPADFVCPYEGLPSGGSVADAFTTILYGIAVTQVALDGAKADSGFPVALALAAVLYFFVDWLSRVYLPSRLPCTDRLRVEKLGVRVAKSILEIALVYSLLCVSYAAFNSTVTTRLALAPLAQSRVVVWFCVFLVLTFVWNLLMLYVMEDLSWRRLAILSLRGRAAEDPKFQEYGKNLQTKLAALDDAVKNLPGESDMRKKSIITSILACRAMIMSFGQLIVNHLVWAPIAATAVLLLSIFLRKGGPVFPIMHLMQDLPGPLGWLALGASAVLLIGLLVNCFVAYVAIRLDPELDGAHAIVAQVLVFILLLTAALSASVLLWQPSLAPLWFIVLASLALPAIPTYLTNSRRASAGTVSPRRSGWIGGMATLLVLPFAYLTLNAGELVLFLVFESVTVCLFLSFCAPAVIRRKNGGEEAAK